MRWGILTLASIVILVVAGIWFLGPWTVLKTVGALVLGLIVFGTGLLGYICIRAKAWTWGAGFFAVAVICALGIFRLAGFWV